mmetsp:Transcript_1483/g.2511  ORF Transcript_1483/g.2511 Transcript_1483/m.2511 type:complete len:116 (+) Transcript_1483:112-459(+)
MVQGLIGEGLLHFIEVCLGMVYLAAVLYNLYWFLKPLADREEFDALSRWIEVRVDHAVDVTMKPFHRLKTKAVYWLREIGMFTREKNGEEKDERSRTKLRRDDPFNSSTEDRKKM